MIRYANRTLCPSCGTPLPAQSRACPGCALPLHDPLAGEVFTTLTRADALMDRWRAKIPAPTASPARPTAAPAAPTGPTPPPTATVPPEWVSQVAPAPRSSGLTVPQLLLGLGALCLVVAAGAFLALTWASLSLGARTAVLIALTAVAGAASWFAQGRRLRGSAEAAFTVFAALLTFDLTGAFDAGWFGDVGGAGQVAVTSSVVALSGVAWSFASHARHGRALTSAQVVTVLGALSGSLAASVDLPTTATMAVGVMILSGLSLLGRARIWRPLQVSGLLGAWVMLAPTALWTSDDLANATTLSAAWRDGLGWSGLVSAAAVVVLAVASRPGSRRVLSLGLGVALSLVIVTLVAPLSDAGHDLQLGALVALTAASAVALALTPRTWGAVAGVPTAVATAVAAPFAVIWSAAGVLHLLTLTSPLFSRPATWSPGTLDVEYSVAWLPALTLVAGAALAVAALRSPQLPRTRSTVTGAIGWVALATAATLPLVSGMLAAPLVAVVLGELVVAGAAAAWAARTRWITPAVAAGALALVALVLAESNAWLTLTVLVVMTVAAVALSALRTATAGRPGNARPAFGATAVVTGGLALLTGLWLTPLSSQWWMFVVVAALGVLVLALPKAWIEAPAVAVGALALSISLGETPLPALLDRCAMILTLLGAIVVAHGLIHSSRRWALPVGGALLAGASWCRLVSLEVDIIEWYTLPTALVLVALGLWRMRTGTSRNTRTVLTPGLSLATVPSLLVVWATDVATLRGVLLAAACVALLLAGSLLRWAAPVLVGGVVGTALALQALAPVVSDLPIWIVAAVAGAILVTVGVTWEARIRDLRTLRFRFHELS